MPRFIKSDDLTIGHCWPPCPGVHVVPPKARAIGVTMDGATPVIQTDVYDIHPGPCGIIPPHPTFVVRGSPDVFIGGLSVLRDGDPLSCGDVANSLGGSVFINGGGLGGPAAEGGDPNQTTGFVTLAPRIIYPPSQISYTAYSDETQNIFIFQRGCPLSIKPNAYTPLKEEITGREFANYPGEPFSNLIGAPDLPSYAPDTSRDPIPLINFSLSADPRGFMEKITNGVILPGINVNYETGEIYGEYFQVNVTEIPPPSINIRVSIENFVGTSTQDFRLDLIRVAQC